MRIFCLLLSLSLSGVLLAPASYAQNDSGSKYTFNDGPYIFYENGLSIARWVRNGQLETDTLRAGAPMKIEAGVSASFNPAYLHTDGSFEPSLETTFKGVDKIAAVSDIHGQYEVLLKLLQVHHIVDDGGNWAFGQGHLVVVGDVFDRGDEVTEILWLIHKLEQQAEQANGKVHYLLGNHEVMVLQGDLRYINKKYRYTSASMRLPYNEIFGPDTYLGRWLRSKPIAISINKTAFVHAGFSQQYLQLGLSNEQLNETFREQIIGQPEDSILAKPLLRVLYDEQGPIWYRGYFDEGFTKTQAQAILRQIRKKNIVVGHTSFEAIVSLFRNKIIGIDSSIKFGKSGEILLYENKHFYRGTLAGERVPLK